MELSLPKPRAHTLPALWQAMFLISLPFGILSFVMPIYGKELGATALEIGGLFSALALVPVIVRPFLGRALDRWGRRPFLLLGLGGYVAAMIVFCCIEHGVAVDPGAIHPRIGASVSLALGDHDCRGCRKCDGTRARLWSY